jgi:hypothetical protein
MVIERLARNAASWKARKYACASTRIAIRCARATAQQLLPGRRSEAEEAGAAGAGARGSLGRSASRAGRLI